MKRSERLIMLLAIAASLCIMGCSKSRRYDKKPYSMPANPETAFDNAKDIKPSANTLYTAANIIAKQGRDAEYEAVLRRIINEYPKFLQAHNSLAEFLVRKGRTTEAMSTLGKALDFGPRDTVLINNMGMCCLLRKQYDKALLYFTRAAGVMPENARYRANMGVTLSLMDRYDESLALFKQVITADRADNNIKVIKRSKLASNT